MKWNPIPENKNCSVSKDQSIARNRELFCEMARVGNMNNELEVWVRTDDGGNLPHFHIWDKNSQGGKFHTCVQIKQPAYFHHTGKEGVLNTSQRKELVEFLKTGWLIDGPNRDILYSRRASQRNILQLGLSINYPVS